MRLLLIFLALLGLFPVSRAADATGRVLKVLPLFLDHQGRDSTAPSLFERDAYQAWLRSHTNEISAVRFDVQWKAAKTSAGRLQLRAELRGIGADGLPKLKTLETEIAPHTFRAWTSLTLGGEDRKNFGSLAAWRVTLWNGDQLIGEQKSFLW